MRVARRVLIPPWQAAAGIIPDELPQTEAVLRDAMP